MDDDGGGDPTLEAAGVLAFLDAPPGQPYDHAILLDAHVCALRVGWLDVALAPLLRNPQTLLSGSVLQYDCDTRSKKSAPVCRENKSPVHEMAGILSMRVGRRGRALLDHAYQNYSDLPITKAIRAAAKDRVDVPADAVFANPRLLALHAPADKALFKDAAYYGLEARVALVHAPHWLRAPSPVALAARLDLRHNLPAVAIVLPPAGVPGMQSLLRSTWSSFVDAGIPAKNIVFLACSHHGLVEASSMAAFQVLMTMATTSPSGGVGDPRKSPGGGEPGSPPGGTDPNPCSVSAILEAVASLVRAGTHSMLVVGLDAVATGSARAALSSLGNVDAVRPVFYLQAEGEVPMQQAPTSPSASPMNVGAILIILACTP